jgi:hypothetical protein
VVHGHAEVERVDVLIVCALGREIEMGVSHQRNQGGPLAHLPHHPGREPIGELTGVLADRVPVVGVIPEEAGHFRRHLHLIGVADVEVQAPDHAHLVRAENAVVGPEAVDGAALHLTILPLGVLIEESQPEDIAAELPRPGDVELRLLADVVQIDGEGPVGGVLARADHPDRVVLAEGARVAVPAAQGDGDQVVIAGGHGGKEPEVLVVLHVLVLDAESVEPGVGGDGGPRQGNDGNDHEQS